MRLVARDSGTNRVASSTVSAPTGTLTMKIHGHETRSVSTPPSSSPAAAPPAAIALHTPSARVRSALSVKVVVMIDIAAGETSAPPSPCSARPAISMPED